MKVLLTATIIFTPTNRTLDFLNVSNFSIKKLFAVINLTAGTTIYTANGAASGTGYTSLSGSVLLVGVK